MPSPIAAPQPVVVPRSVKNKLQMMMRRIGSSFRGFAGFDPACVLEFTFGDTNLLNSILSHLNKKVNS